MWSLILEGVVLSTTTAKGSPSHGGCVIIYYGSCS